MHGTFDKLGKNNNRIHRSWSIGFFAAPVFLALALIGLAMFQPAASVWISEAAQAEFSGTSIAPRVLPTQLAQPAGETQTTRAN
jgi:hypothetical protein